MATEPPRNALRPCPKCGERWVTDADSLHPDLCYSCGWTITTPDDAPMKTEEE